MRSIDLKKSRAYSELTSVFGKRTKKTLERLYREYPGATPLSRYLSNVYKINISTDGILKIMRTLGIKINPKTTPREMRYPSQGEIIRTVKRIGGRLDHDSLESALKIPKGRLPDVFRKARLTTYSCGLYHAGRDGNRLERIEID